MGPVGGTERSSPSSIDMARPVVLPADKVATSSPVELPRQTDVLLVEDDEDLRGGFVEILREARYSTAEAANASEALYSVRSMRFRAVLLDVYLPDHSGLWLLDQLDDPPPIVLITGHDYDLEVMSRQSKVLMYLQKPIKPPDLLAATAQAVAAGRG